MKKETPKEQIDVAALGKAVQQNEALDATLHELLSLAERKHTELAARNALQKSVDESLRDANTMLTETLTLLAAHRDKQKHLQSQLRSSRVAAISQYTNLIAQREDELNNLRATSKQLDLELIASEGELKNLEQRLVTARLMVADDSDRQDVAETEHSMLQNEALYAAMRSVPTVAQAQQFFAKFETDQFTDTRLIRELTENSS